MIPRMYAAVVVPAAVAPPPGIDADAFRRALVEDLHDAVAELHNVVPVLAGGDQAACALAAEVAWRETPVIAFDPGGPVIAAVLDALAGLGAELGAVLAGDAPDFPGLLVGKLLGALEDQPVAVNPAEGGGLVGLASRLPMPQWLRASGIELDTADAVDRLHALAPRRSVVVGAGWHRLRAAGDVARLDPALEGWAATRCLLSATRS